MIEDKWNGTPRGVYFCSELWIFYILIEFYKENGVHNRLNNNLNYNCFLRVVLYYYIRYILFLLSMEERLL